MSLFCLKHGNGSLHLQIKIKISWCGMLGSANFHPAFHSSTISFCYTYMHTNRRHQPICRSSLCLASLHLHILFLQFAMSIFFSGLSSYSSFRICLLQETFNTNRTFCSPDTLHVWIYVVYICLSMSPRKTVLLGDMYYQLPRPTQICRGIYYVTKVVF